RAAATGDGRGSRRGARPRRGQAPRPRGGGALRGRREAETAHPLLPRRGSPRLEAPRPRRGAAADRRTPQHGAGDRRARLGAARRPPRTLLRHDPGRLRQGSAALRPLPRADGRRGGGTGCPAVPGVPPGGGDPPGVARGGGGPHRARRRHLARPGPGPIRSGASRTALRTDRRGRGGIGSEGPSRVPRPPVGGDSRTSAMVSIVVAPGRIPAAAEQSVAIERIEQACSGTGDVDLFAVARVRAHEALAGAIGGALSRVYRVLDTTT